MLAHNEVSSLCAWPRLGLCRLPTVSRSPQFVRGGHLNYTCSRCCSLLIPQYIRTNISRRRRRGRRRRRRSRRTRRTRTRRIRRRMYTPCVPLAPRCTFWHSGILWSIKAVIYNWCVKWGLHAARNLTQLKSLDFSKAVLLPPPPAPHPPTFTVKYGFMCTLKRSTSYYSKKI